MKNIIKNILLPILSLVVFLSIMEISARTFAFLYSRDILSFRYGIDGSVRLNIRNKKIAFVKDEKVKRTAVGSERQKAAPDSIVRIVTFGGSTTYGYFNGKSDSSWPDELERILNLQYGSGATKYEVLNLAANGANTDYLVERLPFSKSKGKVDYILWASFVNESDIIYFGPKRNLEKLYEEFGDILRKQNLSFVINKHIMLINRIDKTFKKYSIFYNLFYKLIHREVSRAVKMDIDIVGDWYKNKITDSLVALGLRNYEINFMEAKRYCDLNGIQLILIREPLKDISAEEKRVDANSRFVSTFREALDNLMAEFAKRYNVPLINVHEHYMINNFYQAEFYDGAHQGLKGHILTAEFIAEELSGYILKHRKGLEED